MNLNENNCKYKLLLNNLNFNKNLYKKFYLTKDFLSTSSKLNQTNILKSKSVLSKY